eukprot:gb/GEZN01004562.1/.p1 GENE.gb/GEZN01004562.1/~~gb/GEZN01004562.1/.p1  ORF type:complete len:452 (+),score=32.58 gb/GEZN01004562.1/:398-1753(+)
MTEEEDDIGTEQSPLVTDPWGAHVSSSRQDPPKQNNKQKSFVRVMWELRRILPSLVVETVGVSMIIPHMPAIIEEFFQGDKNLTYWASGGNLGLNAFLTFFCAPILGKLSDSIGRKPLLLLAISFSHLHILALALDLNLWLFFLSYGITGIFGSSYPLFQAYVADSLPVTDRASGFAQLIGFMAIGGVIGFALGGLLTDFWACRVPIGLASVNIIYSGFVFNESLDPRFRVQFSVFGIAPWHGLYYLGKTKLIANLAAMTLMATIAIYGVNDCIIMYLKVQMDFPPAAISVFLVLSFFSMAAVQLILFPIVAPRFISYHTFLLIIMGVSTTCMFLYVVATQLWQFYLICIFAPMVSIAWTMASSIATNQVSPSEQGVLQGAFAGLNKLGGGLGPLLFDTIAGATTQTLPAAPFLVGALFNIIAACLAVMLPVEAVNNMRRDQRQPLKTEAT